MNIAILTKYAYAFQHFYAEGDVLPIKTSGKWLDAVSQACNAVLFWGLLADGTACKMHFSPPFHVINLYQGDTHAHTKATPTTHFSH